MKLKPILFFLLAFSGALSLDLDVDVKFAGQFSANWQEFAVLLTAAILAVRR